MHKINVSGVDVPLFSNIINFGLYDYERLSSSINSLSSNNIERDKIPLLCNDNNYINFLKAITQKSYDQILMALNDFYNDSEFNNIFIDKLNLLDTLSHPGDLRFHGITLYVLVRILAPKIIIETGVASGKSSAFILLAMHHNNMGKLYSIDLPNNVSNKLDDGACTSTEKLSTGWLVPDYLRSRWCLNIGDSTIILPTLLNKIQNKVDIFIHDSLHTYEHVKFEFNTVLKHSSDSLLICDNIDTGAGLAFSDVLNELKRYGAAYRDFASMISK